MIDDLEEQVAELILEPVEILARDRIGDFVGFLDRVRRDGREALLHVPRTAAFWVAQARHHSQQILERVLFAQSVSHEGACRAAALKA